MSDSLLPDALLRQLAPLAFRPQALRVVGRRGERRSAQRGMSTEFADYRNYIAGDDLRKLDWNIYARLNKLIVKVFEDEQDLSVHVLLDASASMGATEQTNSTKWLFCQQLTSALGAVALNKNDRLTVTRLGNSEAFEGRGNAKLVPLLRWMRTLEPAGHTDLNATLTDFAQRERHAGICLIISDFFSPTGYAEGLEALRARGHEVVVIHVLSPEEVRPEQVGDVRLIDVETEAGQDLSIDATLYALYQHHLQAWQTEIRAMCAKYRIAYAFAVSDSPAERVLLHDLRQLGTIK